MKGRQGKNEEKEDPRKNGKHTHGMLQKRKKKEEGD